MPTEDGHEPKLGLGLAEGLHASAITTWLHPTLTVPQYSVSAPVK